MNLSTCLRKWFRRRSRPRPGGRHPLKVRLYTESLEPRLGPSINVIATFPAITSSGGYKSSAGLIEDSKGDLFGTTSLGGAYGYGTVFEVPAGTGTVVTLASFDGANGAYPEGKLVEDSNGNLFGTTTTFGFRFNNGNIGGVGTVFELPAGSGTITTLVSLDGINARTPYGGLVEDSSGNLFGTSLYGGPGHDGTVFELSPEGNQYLFTIVAPFNFTNGAGPTGDLLLDSSGNLFGTTFYGPTSVPSSPDYLDGYGTVFEVPAGPVGSRTIKTLAAFDYSTTGSQPRGGLVEDSNGNLFGTTGYGGAYDLGTVFEVPAAGGAITTLASFGNANAFASRNSPNGAIPNGGLVEDSSGDLFGTTSDHGTYHGSLGIGFGPGTIFEVIAGSNAITTLASFPYDPSAYPNSAPDGGDPLGGLVEDSNGNLFGTTSGGGPVTADDANPGGTVFEVSIPVITTAPLSAWSVNEPGYQSPIGAKGGTGTLTFSQSGTLPPGLTLSSSGLLSGTPTAAGSYTFTVAVTDSVGATTSRSFTIAIGPAGSPGSLDGFLVSPSSTIQAGTAMLVTVQATDAFGNPVNASGAVPITISPANAGSSVPSFVMLNALGQGYFLATMQQAGSYTITVGGGALAGSTSVTVTPGPAVRLAFAATPANSPTGDAIPPVRVQVDDIYGNVITSDNSDTVTLGVGSGPGGFTSGSTLTATVHNGIATFNNLTLVTPGQYQLSAIVPGLYTGPYSGNFSVLPLQVLPGSFAGTPSGFSLQLNAPVLVNPLTPALYGSGAGGGATVLPTVTLTQTSGTPPTGAALPYPVPGSLIVDPATNTLTFVETDTASVVGNGTPLLPDGSYLVHISGSGGNGLQALNAGGGYLDGTNAGTPGHDYTATFTVGAAAAGDDVLWVPATAEGPGQALTAPGMNQIGGGYPVYLDDRGGQVTDVQATLTYNPSLLTVTPTSTATFTVTVPSAGTALVHYHGPALAAGTQTPIGFLTAKVPAGTAASPMPYKATDLLVLSGISLNGGTVPALGSQAVHVVAYVGDADGNGAYSSSDALLVTRVTLQTDTGFGAYPLVDPIIVADTDGSGFIPADAALQVNEAGVGVPTANLPIPPIPGGVHFQAAIFHAHTATSLPASTEVASERLALQPAAQRPGRRAAGRIASSPLIDFFIADRKILDLYFARLEDRFGS
jgi:uncharacterized repeat protein (TIGR03803 family)